MDCDGDCRSVDGDDESASVGPSADEVCHNANDDDCDGLVDAAEAIGTDREL